MRAAQGHLPPRHRRRRRVVRCERQRRVYRKPHAADDRGVADVVRYREGPETKTYKYTARKACFRQRTRKKKKHARTPFGLEIYEAKLFSFFSSFRMIGIIILVGTYYYDLQQTFSSSCSWALLCGARKTLRYRIKFTIHIILYIIIYCTRENRRRTRIIIYTYVYVPNRRCAFLRKYYTRIIMLIYAFLKGFILKFPPEWKKKKKHVVRIDFTPYVRA